MSANLEDIVAAMLTRPVAFHPVLAKMTGRISAGLMLSQAIYWTKVQERTKPEADGWFYKTQAEWTEEICLTRSEQEGAREVLCRFDFWREDRRGQPAKMYFRVDMEKLTSAISQYAENLQSRMRESGTLECGKAANKSAENPHTINTESTSESTSDTPQRPARVMPEDSLQQETKEAGFAAFWECWPKKQDRQDAIRAWMKIPLAEYPPIMAGLERWKQSDQWTRGVIPHAATWLNKKRWQDEDVPGKGGNSGNVMSFSERRSQKSARAIDTVLGRLEKASGDIHRALPPANE